MAAKLSGCVCVEEAALGYSVGVHSAVVKIGRALASIHRWRVAFYGSES